MANYYISADREVTLNENEYSLYITAFEYFGKALKREQAYISFGRTIVFSPDARAEHGKFYEASEMLKLTNEKGYRMLVQQLCRKYAQLIGED